MNTIFVRTLLTLMLAITSLSAAEVSEKPKAREGIENRRLPFMLKSPRLALIAESDGVRVSAFDLQNGRLLWTVDLSKEWEDDWTRPAHGLPNLFILSLRFGSGKFSGYIEVELNDGKIGYIALETGQTKNPIQNCLL